MRDEEGGQREDGTNVGPDGNGRSVVLAGAIRPSHLRILLHGRSDHAVDATISKLATNAVPIPLLRLKQEAECNVL